MNDNSIWYILGIVVALIILFLISKSSFGSMPYERRNLLTKTEYAFWKVLQRKADENHLRVCPKVRMEDFLAVNTKNERSKMS